MVNRKEALRYLGYNGSDITPQVRGLLDFCEEQANIIAEEKFIYKKYNITVFDGKTAFENTNLVLESRQLSKMLEGCPQAYLLALTVGSAADRAVREYMISEPDKGVVLDSMFSSAAEELANKAQAQIEAEIKRPLTPRFSPGYGDLPLFCQSEILRLLDAQKRIGLFATAAQMLTPTKSVTAVIGIK